jgi:hypothetical protein
MTDKFWDKFWMFIVTGLAGIGLGGMLVLIILEYV